MTAEHEAHRPEFHLTPARHWMNDPNGLIHHGGRWHVFFQHNPEGGDWGNMSWGHASSPDLVHWTEHPVALAHTPDEVVYSGSVVAEGDRLHALYTRVTPGGSQAQSLATSTDGGLTWERYDGNPVLDRGTTDFRDPKVFGHDGGWVMVAVEATERRVLLHRSEDLVSWDYLSDVGPAGPATEHCPTQCWECPDLFPLLDEDGVERWVLVVSVLPGGVAGGSGTCWFVGDFDGTAFTALGWGWLDHGPDCYAGVTFTDAPDGRRVLMAWMSNWDYAREVPTAPFRGAMTIPRELSLRTVGGEPRLVQRPARELAAYAHVVTAQPGPGEEVVVELLVAGEQRTLLTWADGILTLDRTRSGQTGFHPAFPSVAAAPVPLEDGLVTLEIYVDRCSVEVFAQDGLVCLTMLVLPPEGAIPIM